MFAQMFPCLPHLETLAFIEETKFASRKETYFLPNSETFDESLFLRLPTLIRQYMTYQNIGKTNNMTNIFGQKCFPICPGL
jgi:hypothetical protein